MKTAKPTLVVLEECGRKEMRMLLGLIMPFMKDELDVARMKRLAVE